VTAALAPRTVQVRRRRLHPGQLRLKASTARFRVAMFGRRWGKNVAGIDEAMEDALAGKRVGWFEPTYKYFIEAWREMCHRLAPVTKHKDDQDKRLELITGGVIEGWTCDTPDPARSRAYHTVIINEAGLIRGLLAIWQESIRPTLTDYQGSALFLGTPKGRTHDFSVLHAKAASTDGWEAFRGPTSENPWLPKAEIAAAKAELPPQVFAQEYEGIPADDGGNPFGLDAIIACTMTPEEWLKAQGAETIAWGWDFGRAQDYTFGVALGRKYQVTRFDRWQLVPWHVTYQKVTEQTGGVPAWGDSTGIGDVIVESLQTMACPMQGYVFSRPSKQLLMQRLASVIQSRRLRIPPGVIISELETFGYEYTASGVRYTAPEGMHDDGVMALALAVYGRDQFGELPDVKVKRAMGDDDHPGFRESGARIRRPTGLPGRQQPARPSFIPGRGPLVEVE
jgi:hypothetical protein